VILSHHASRVSQRLTRTPLRRRLSRNDTCGGKAVAALQSAQDSPTSEEDDHLANDSDVVIGLATCTCAVMNKSKWFVLIDYNVM
jgi:hypothetical protein